MILSSWRPFIPSRPAEPAAPAAWASFVRAFAATAAAAFAALFGFVVALDPYGTRTGPGVPPKPIMDLNGRTMFPQIARSGRYDSAAFGTSTIRLLDPAALARAFGGRFASLGLNGGTPWEQVELAKLFVRHVPASRTLLFGLDRPWCDPDADAEAKRITFRSFPPWLYDEVRLNDLAGMLSLRSLEFAGRLALHRLGLMRERIRNDGYEVFTPPEASYDLARARAHIWAGTSGRVEPVSPPATLDPQVRAALRFPALAWLDGLLASLPRETRVTLVLPPVHVAAQPTPGSPDAAVDAACKEAIATLARRRGALAVDLRVSSDVTTNDANYWDKLHYRLAVADRIVAALAEAAATGQGDAGGFYRVLSSGR